MRVYSWSIIISFAFCLNAGSAKGHQWYSSDTLPVPCNTEEILEYNARFIVDEIVIDGVLDETVWQQVEKSPRFTDLISGKETRYDTRAAVCWDSQYLYVAYWVEEPFLQAMHTERDAYIYQDNDVELFIAGRDAYYELEINAYGTIYEVFFIWEDGYYKSGYDTMPEFDKNQEKTRVFPGVGYRPHPRGLRTGFWKWDFPGLRTAVHVEGTINDDSDFDKGWTVELALPWSGMASLAFPDKRSLPPLDGDMWRMDFSRFNQKKAPPPAEDSRGWSWNPHGVWDSHVPACFTKVYFRK